MAQDKYLEVADALGARLCRDAIWSGDSCNWTGDFMKSVDSRWQVVHETCGPVLYNGTAGIALFLANLFAFTRNEALKRTAQGALNCALSFLDQFDAITGFAFYSGLTGIAYALMETGELCGEEEFVAGGFQLLEVTSSVEPSLSQSWDVISGSAGVVPILLKLHARYGREFLWDAALRHGELLVQAATRGEEGWSWKTTDDPEMKPLTGFSHGAAGIAWALLELYGQTKESRFLEGAQQALDYERRCFNPQQENWPDFRTTRASGDPVFAVAWCHGAPGIGLARLRCYQILEDRELLAEAQAAQRTTSRFLTSVSGQANYSLCHGNFGNAELLITASDILADHASLKIVHDLADEALQKYHPGRAPWPCGVLNGGETPNLMLGLAGIGYFYLRLYDRKVPSVLLVGPD